jgi:hypothetical protein
LVEGGDRHIEILGELLHRDEPVLAFHASMVGRHPLKWLSFALADRHHPQRYASSKG